MDMTANELRLGNLVKLSNSDYWHKDYKNKQQIVDFDILKEIEFHPKDENGKDLYEPIPLTEEWLVRLGFRRENKKESEQHDNYFSTSIIDINFCLAYAHFRDDYGLYIEYTDSPHESDDGTKYFVSCGIKYVHQLMNLFFALTGQELTIKE